MDMGVDLMNHSGIDEMQCMVRQENLDIVDETLAMECVVKCGLLNFAQENSGLFLE